jgi:hypothetical protein
MLLLYISLSCAFYIHSFHMKWTFIIQQKIKLALLLTALIIVIGLTAYTEKKNVKEMGTSFASIYYDRLVPATDLFHITENLFQRRIVLEGLLSGRDNDLIMPSQDQLLHYHLATNGLVSKFEKTFLVEAESNALSNFKKSLKEYKKVEDRVVGIIAQNLDDQGRRLYETEGKEKFNSALNNLHQLSTIQSTVGLDILKESKSTISNSELMLTLQILTAIIIGLIIHALIVASRMINIENRDFHLN